ncbi:MAG: flagellar basal-body MS-ring/collar protein FliF [Gammaproteobacteria bacterium]
MQSAENLKLIKNVRAAVQTPFAKQLMFMVGVAASVAVGIGVYHSFQEPIYRPLDYQVGQQNMSMIVDTLEKAGIRYKMNDSDGLIFVPAKDLQQAKLRLSAAGVAKDDSFNFQYLNEQGGIGSSQFMESARYLRALESDLSKTIGGIEGIAFARVHIAIPENNIFADENRRPTASVVVSAAPGFMLDKDKIRAIVQVIASSVPGLDPKDVAITDQYGHYLSGVLNEDSLYNAEQLTYQNNIQNFYEKRIQSMVVPLIGENKVSVRVFANIDFSQSESADEKYDPKSKVIRSEQQSSTSSSDGAGASGPPGSLSNTPPESDADKKAAPGGAAAGGNSSSESTKNYEIDKSVTYKKSNAAKVTALSVAVVVDNETTYDAKSKKSTSKPISQDKLNKITDLVKATIGYDEKRGDKVTVVNSSFMPLPAMNDGASSHMWDEPWFWDMVKRFMGIALGLSILFMLYRRMSSYAKTSTATELVAVSDDREGYYMTPEMQALKQEQINRLKELANREPNRVASVIKNWIGK